LKIISSMSVVEKRKPKVFFVSAISSLTIAVLSICILIGWMTNNEILKGSLAAGIAVKTNTAIAFLCSAIALALHLKENSKNTLHLTEGTLGLIVTLIGALTLIQHFFEWNLGIDELLFSEPEGVTATTSPNRMGPPASICFILSGISILLLSTRRGYAAEIASKLGVLIGVIALLPSLGYLFGAKEIYGLAGYTGISLTTALLLLILSTAIISSCTGSAMLTLLQSPDAGGVLARRLLPPALFLPPLLGYVRTIGERSGLYDAALGRSLLIVAFILIFARLVWASARVLQTTDKERLDLFESERAARSNAERANRFKDEFLATLSHELRTPLNAILGWTQLLKRKFKDNPELSSGLDIIERNSKLQAQLIADLLDMSRIISGKLRLELKQVNLAHILQAAIETIRISAEEKQITIEKHLGETDVIVLGDPNRLQQVFWNILSNSVKFTPSGGYIVISLRVEENVAEVSVTDTGQGIAPELLNQIFDRFIQADSSTTRKHGGLGIGLSVVKELIGLHKGAVSAISPGPGHGSTFFVTIPLASVSPTAQKAIEAHDKLPSQDISLRDIRVLVVDDDSDARKVTGNILSQYHAEVSFAASANEALSLLKEFSPHVLVSDIGMPDLDGYHLIETIRSQKQTSEFEMPAIALTAFVREEDKAKAIKSGYQAHLSKPVDAHDLVALVSKLTIGLVKDC